MTALTLFVTARTRFALRYKRDDTHEHVITMTTGQVDAIAVPHETFVHDYQDAEFANLHCRIPPTPERFLDVLAHTNLLFTEQAINALKEIEAMTKMSYVSSKGELLNDLGANDVDAVPIDWSISYSDNASRLESTLNDKALAVFVVEALRLPKPLVRVRAGDARIVQSLVAWHSSIKANNDVATITQRARTMSAAVTSQSQPQSNVKEKQMATRKQTAAAAATATEQQPAATVAPKGKNVAAKKAVAKATTAPAKKNGAEKGPSVKQLVHEALKGGRKTFEQLLKITGRNEGSVRTAITDLKNPKYAGLGGKSLKIDRDDKGAYFLAK